MHLAKNLTLKENSEMIENISTSFIEPSPLTVGAIIGLSIFFLLFLIAYNQKRVIKLKISDAPLKEGDLKFLKKQKLPIDLILDAHIEVIKSNYPSDIIKLGQLYMKTKNSILNSHSLRQSYIEEQNIKQINL